MKKSEIKSIIFESVEQLKEYIGKLRDEYKRAYNLRDAEAVVYYNSLMNDDSTNEADVPDFNKVFKHGPAYAKWKQDHAREIADRQHAFSKTSSTVTKPVPAVAEEGEEKPFSMEESAPPGFPKALHDKLVGQYGETPKAYATMWKIHKAKNEGNQKVTEMWIAMEGKIIPEVGATFATNCPAPEEKPSLPETGNLFDPGMLESSGNTNDILQALIDRKNSLRPQEENLHQGLMAAIDVVRKMQQGGLREGIFSNGRGLLYSKEMFYIQSVLEFDVKVEFEFYRGTNQPDDPSEVVIKEIIAEEDTPDDFDTVNNAHEMKLIFSLRYSIKSLYPNTKPGVLIPKGADFVQINKKLKNYLDTDIEKLQETLFEKMTKY